MPLSTMSLMINGYCERFLHQPFGSVSVSAFISERPFDELVGSQEKDLMDVKLDVEKPFEESGSKYWRVSALRKTKSDEILKGDFIALQDGLSLFVITGYSGRFVRSCIDYIFQRLYPFAIRVYVASNELRRILEHFSSMKNVELLFKNFVAKKMFGEAVTYLHYAKRKVPKEFSPLPDAFEEARGNEAWIDSIRVFALRSSFDFWFSRSCTLKFYRGNFSDYYDSILTSVSEHSLVKRKLFEKRSRVDQVDKRVVRPLLIRFGSDVFKEQTLRKQLIDKISEYKQCTFSVVHEGNPHIYVSIVDRADNSSFALRTYGLGSLLLIPQIKTSHASLMRFSKFLLDNFREGELTELAV